MKFFRNLKHIFFIVMVSLMMTFSIVFVFGDTFTNSLNGFFLYRTGNGVWQDIFHKHTLTPSQDIVIIKIDEKTLNEFQAKNSLKNLTIPKSTYAIMTQKLEEVGVKGIAYDIMFQNADSGEKIFADILSKYTNVVIATDYTGDLCVNYYNSTYTELGSGSVQNKYPKQVTPSECLVLLKDLMNDYAEVIKPNIPPGYEILQKKGAMSLTNAEKLSIFCSNTEDNIVDCPGLPRSVYAQTRWGIIDFTSVYERPVSIDISNQPYKIWKVGDMSRVSADELQMSTLPLALYKSIYPQASITESFLPTYTRALSESSNNRTEITKHTLQPYFGTPQDSYPQVSFVDVMDMSQSQLSRNFAGKYVFVGESGTHINDSKTSPVTGTNMDGIEYHAHFFDGLLQDKMFQRLNMQIMFLLIIFLTIGVVSLYYFTPKFLSPILAGVLLCGILYSARFVYSASQVVMDITMLLSAAGLITYPVTYTYKFFIVDKAKRELQNNFGHYIDPAVVKQIAERNEDIQLGGERRVLSVLFSDIAGFTTISESMNPQELFYLMTSYLSNMTDILIQRGGTLDKYIGDAVMGFFGAPLSYEDHAIRAADTAILMRTRLPLFNDDLVRHGMQPIDFRVGIATGDVMVGNIGSHDRFNYTVLGDTVNLASRLEGTGKEYDVHIIIPEATEKLLGSLYLTRELDTIAVKGKTEGVRIYELIGYAKDYPDRLIYINYEKALELYRKGDYREAGKLWQKQAQVDPPSHVMMYRCLGILKGHIHVKNGIYQMTHK